jgi:hypothetical protein
VAVWPRSGGDRGNRSVIPVKGPALRGVVHEIALSVPADPPGTTRIAGGATAADGSLRVMLRDVLFAIDPDTRRVRWSCDLRALAIRRSSDPDDADRSGDKLEEDEPPPRHSQGSLPAILDGDRTLVTAAGTAIIVDARGELCERVAVPMVDDSGPPPNTNLEGRPILTTMDGEVHVWHADGLRSVGRGFGYDVVPVAVYADGTLAVSGYAGTGFCRAGGDGGVIWRSDLGDPDLLPTVNRLQHAAVGSLNEHCSAIFDPEGRRLGTYPAAAVFAEYEAGHGWIALAKDALARLTPSGEVQWSHPLGSRGLRWGCYQPIIDAGGTIYIATNDGLAAFDGSGAHRAALSLGGQPMPLIPVRAGLMAAIVGDTLLLID